jgi:hypothetical protein
VLQVERDLMRRQSDLLSTIDYFELKHDKLAFLEPDQDVGDPEPNPTFEAGQMAVAQAVS